MAQEASWVKVVVSAMEVTALWKKHTLVRDVVGCTLALLGTWALQRVQLSSGFTQLPAAAFLLWTFLVSLWFGRTSGLCAAIAGTLACNYLLAPFAEFSTDAQTLVAMLLFFSIALALVACVATLQNLVARERGVAAEKQVLASSLSEALSVRDTFLAIAGHELKTPLTGLFLRVQTWRRRLLRGSQNGLALEQVDSLIVGLVRLKSLVDSLLDVSRATSGSVVLHCELVDLDELVLGVVHDMADAAEVAGCAITVQAGSNSCGQWDRMRLEQVVSNILSNACKYARGQPIWVKTAAVNNHATLQICDQGPGIAADNQKKVFERFTRLRHDGTIGGLGLGLWIVRELVEAMNGTIHIESALGHGCTFVVDLPINHASTPPST